MILLKTIKSISQSLSLELFNMEKISNKKRYSLFLIGIIVLTLGVALTIKADFGVGSWDAVNVALNRIYGLSVGIFAIIIAVIMTVMSGLLREGKFNFYTLITALLLGIFTDFWLYVIERIIVGNSLFIRSSCFILGIILLSFGIALYIRLELAPNSLDDFMIALNEKFNIIISVSKLIIDVFGLIIGLFLNGPIGLGTLIITIALGPLIGFFDKRLKKVM